MTSRTGNIRALNDELRSTGCGGITVVTRGIAALSAPDLAAVIAAVQSFDDFSAANDPWTKPLRGSCLLQPLIMGADLAWSSAR